MAAEARRGSTSSKGVDQAWVSTSAEAMFAAKGSKDSNRPNFRHGIIQLGFRLASLVFAGQEFRLYPVARRARSRLGHAGPSGTAQGRSRFAALAHLADGVRPP